MAKKKSDNGVHENGTAVMEPTAENRARRPRKTTPEAEKKRPCMKFGPYPVDKNSNVQVAVWDRQIVLPEQARDHGV